MKLTFLFVVISLTSYSSFAQTVINPKYDSTLAKKYDSDDYGMKMYVLVILKSGTNKTTDKITTDSLFAGHMSNINHMVDIKKLVVAGPISKNDNSYRGIFVLDVKTFEEAEKLLQADPAIREKVLAADLYKWYGSAALPAYLGESDKIWKLGF